MGKIMSLINMVASLFGGDKSGCRGILVFRVDLLGLVDVE